ncbi:MAG TPA: hypothetical protein GX517_10965 [Alicyclobacillus sp.]|nr:hypothetical protein [Alicyclobacillus sp.]
MKRNAFRPGQTYRRARLALKTFAVQEGPMSVCWLYVDLMEELVVEKGMPAKLTDRRLLGVADWIHRRAGVATSRDVQTNKVAGVKSAEEAKRLLHELTSRGFVTAELRRKSVIARLVDEPSTGGRDGQAPPASDDA